MNLWEKTKILVASCDKNADLFYPFYKCLEKYWPNHPEVVYSTENVANPYYRTISKAYDLQQWTRRIRETICELDCDFVVLMGDDIFLRESFPVAEVENKAILVKGKVACLHMEKPFDKASIPYKNGTLIRNPQGKYQTTVSFGFWDKHALIDLLSIGDYNPWVYEEINATLGYFFLVTENGLVDWWFEDKKTGRKWSPIRKGKWNPGVVDFFKKEGINIDCSARGFCKW